jgi:cystathionine beta-lyase family protein involved in aluminum resistance
MANYKERLILSNPVWSDILSRDKAFVQRALIAGGAAGDHTVSGLKKGDQIISIYHLDFDTAAEVAADIKSEFSLGQDNTVLKDEVLNNTAGTDTTGGFIEVMWLAWSD